MHYNDVTLSAIASQITDISTFCSTVGSGALLWKHQSFVSLAFLGEKPPVTDGFPSQSTGDNRRAQLLIPPSFKMGFLPYTKNYALRMRRGCRKRFPRHRLQKKPLVSDPGMHQDTCVTHVPRCMSGQLTRGGGERGKRSRHFWRMRNPQFYVSGKRSMASIRVHCIRGQFKGF